MENCYGNEVKWFSDSKPRLRSVDQYDEKGEYYVEGDSVFDLKKHYYENRCEFVEEDVSRWDRDEKDYFSNCCGGTK